MKSSTLESKTIRPGMGSYSFYASNRRPTSTRGTKVKKSAAKKSKRHPFRAILIIAIVVAASFFGYQTAASSSTKTPVKTTTAAAKTPAPRPSPKTTPAASTPPPVAQTQCSGNTLSRLVIVSISQRHLWACQAGTVAYDSPVVTGMENLAADLTPTGTYRIYGKQTDITLRGSDSTGSWDDPVSYWMPFLHNQYGSYGFHDATWRADSDFGNISPYSDNASHGCVELPLATAKWLYDWTSVGTTVTINS